MKNRAYFDYAATTPVDKRVLAEMLPYFSEIFGNPGSLHFFGAQAQAAVDKARKQIADFFGVDFTGVIFTGSATQANNLMIRGIIKSISNSQFPISKLPHIITSSVEHESVLETCRDLERTGQAEVTYLEVSPQGFIDLSQLKNSLKKETVLVSVMYVNNETGTIQPIQEISRIVREYRQAKLDPQNHAQFSISELPYPLIHTDAAQAVNYVAPIKLDELGVDAMTISSHKVYGPKGIAALISNFQFPASQVVAPIITGGGQELGLFSGTENVPAIVGFAKALTLSLAEKKAEQKRLQGLKQELLRGIKNLFGSAVINGAEPQSSNILNVSFVNQEREGLIYAFDKAGIAVSAGSACQAKALQDSHVLTAMGLDKSRVASAIRFSLGRFTTSAEIEHLLLKLPEVLG